jgi:hypothetical protein
MVRTVNEIANALVTEKKCTFVIALQTERKRMSDVQTTSNAAYANTMEILWEGQSTRAPWDQVGRH